MANCNTVGLLSVVVAIALCFTVSGCSSAKNSLIEDLQTQIRSGVIDERALEQCHTLIPDDTEVTSARNSSLGEVRELALQAGIDVDTEPNFQGEVDPDSFAAVCTVGNPFARDVLEKDYAAFYILDSFKGNGLLLAWE